MIHGHDSNAGTPEMLRARVVRAEAAKVQSLYSPTRVIPKHIFTIEDAREEAQKIIKNAREEAQKLVDDAERERGEIVEDAKQSRKKVRQQTATTVRKNKSEEVAHVLDNLMIEFGKFKDQQSANMFSFAFKLAKLIVKTELRTRPELFISIVEKAIKERAGEAPSLTLHVHPSDVELFQDALKKLSDAARPGTAIRIHKSSKVERHCLFLDLGEQTGFEISADAVLDNLQKDMESA